jgi:hypothetical protein
MSPTDSQPRCLACGPGAVSTQPHTASITDTGSHLAGCSEIPLLRGALLCVCADRPTAHRAHRQLALAVWNPGDGYIALARTKRRPCPPRTAPRGPSARHTPLFFWPPGVPCPHSFPRHAFALTKRQQLTPGCQAVGLWGSGVSAGVGVDRGSHACTTPSCPRAGDAARARHGVRRLRPRRPLHGPGSGHRIRSTRTHPRVL